MAAEDSRPDQPVDRKDIYRSVASMAIENSHNAIKGVWVVLFAGGTAALIRSFHHLISCAALAGTPSPSAECPAFIQNGHGMSSVTLVVSLYIIYILTFYRYYVGNIRVFDLRHIEVVKFVALLKGGNKNDKDSDEYGKVFRYIDQNRRIENIYLILKTLFIVLLTSELNSPPIFLTFYLIVLLLDVFWVAVAARPTIYFQELFLNKFGIPPGATRRNLTTEQRKFKRNLENVFPHRSLSVWKYNNAIHAAPLLIVVTLIIFPNQVQSAAHFGVDAQYVLWVGALTALANCAWDLCLTWGFYNPRFSEAYDLITELPVEAPAAGS